MQIHLWQQFSSNHSASYVVVGEFETAAKAQQVHTLVARMMQEILDWYAPHQYRIHEGKLCPVEQRYAARYGFDWQEPLDWIVYQGSEQRLSLWDRLVMIDVDADITNQTGHQFMHLFKALGGKSAREVVEGHNPNGTMCQLGLFVELQVDFTSAAQAVYALQILDAQDFNRFAEDVDDQVQRHPLLVFHPALSHLSQTEIIELEIQYLEDSHQWDRLWTQYDSLALSSISPSKRMALLQLYEEIRILPKARFEEIYQWREAISLNIEQIEQQDHTLILQVTFYGKLQYGLPALIRYLADLGGKNIRYTAYDTGQT